MDDPGTVRGQQRARDLKGDVHRRSERNRPLLQPCLQCLAAVVRHCDVEIPAGQLFDLVDDRDVRMVENRNGSSLLEESSLGGLVRRQMRAQELQRDETPETPVPGFVHDSHAAARQPLEDFVTIAELRERRPLWRRFREIVERTGKNLRGQPLKEIGRFLVSGEKGSQLRADPGIPAGVRGDEYHALSERKSDRSFEQIAQEFLIPYVHRCHDAGFS